MDSGLGFMVAGALVLLAVSGGFTWYGHVHRPEAINQFARERGLSFICEDRGLGQVIAAWTGIGDASVRAESLLVMPIDGAVGEDLLNHCCGGELVWGSGGQDSRWVFVVRPLAAAFPALDMSPRRPDAVPQARLEEAYSVRCEDAGFVSDLLDSRMVSYLRNQAGQAQVSFVPGAIVVTAQARWTGPLFEELIDFADGISDRIRPCLLKKYPLPPAIGVRSRGLAVADWRLRPVPARVSQRADWPGGL
ncbi:MAG: hypothetical protein Q3997_06765 [Propionibacteriaceae bacterium]|nr:hypothetical protein [Propionibacteriaceae bacterium]